MKRCCTCKKELDISNFHRDRQTPDGLDRRCKKCKKIKGQYYYKTNPNIRKSHKKWQDAHREKMNGYRKNFYDRVRKFNHDIRGELGCAVCREKEPICLDYHHITNKTQEMTSIRTLRRLVSEMIKCIVLCANCHRKVHNNLLDVSKYPTINKTWLESKLPYKRYNIPGTNRWIK